MRQPVGRPRKFTEKELLQVLAVYEQTPPWVSLGKFLRSSPHLPSPWIMSRWMGEVRAYRLAIAARRRIIAHQSGMLGGWPKQRRNAA